MTYKFKANFYKTFNSIKMIAVGDGVLFGVPDGLCGNIKNNEFLCPITEVITFEILSL